MACVSSQNATTARFDCADRPEPTDFSRFNKKYLGRPKEYGVSGVTHLEPRLMNPDECPTYNPSPSSPGADFSESELVHLAREGSEAAFQLLFERHYAAVRGVAARMLLDLAAAEDVAQETFIRAARSLDCISNADGFRSWLFRVATNLCRDHIRASSRRGVREKEFVHSGLLEHDAECEAPIRVLDALASLPQQQREAIVLVFYENLPHAEAARIVGCAVSTISWRIMLAKRHLKSLLRS